MSDIAIRVEGLGKQYAVGEKLLYRTLRDDIVAFFRAPFSRRKTEKNEGFIWALKDVSFEVKQGEVLGIIGRNGAGKSTLLKILSRITEPTEGYAEIYGRVGSLLEVGTGFHPELTGRENIYLNGAILGMRKREIDRKFDEIVEFSEIEKFLDTPVKYYSSGMFVRLAFAVAAHLEPEILLVDEVLAVGDAAFQKKCLGKMSGVAKRGRTVLFVSHQMNAIRRLCSSCVWLHRGRIMMAESTPNVIYAYEDFISGAFQREVRKENDHMIATFLGWAIVNPKEEQSNLLTRTESVTFKIIIKINKAVRNGSHGIALWNSDRQLMWAWATENLNLQPGLFEFVYNLPFLPLRPGSYSWHVSLYGDGKLLDELHCIPDLIIATPPLTHPRDEWTGVLNIPCDFKINRAQT